jgi:flagellar motor switch/type III secretory pathway protein FliN
METGVQPFPWRSLEATSRAQVEARRDARRWIAGHVRLPALAEALRALLGIELEVFVRRAVPRVPRAPWEDAVAVRLGGSGEIPGQGLLEVEVSLAAAIAAGVTRRPPIALAKALAKADAPAASALAGALAAVVAAAARKAHAGPVLRVLAAGSARTLEAELLAEEGEVVAVELTVLLADEAYAARVLFGPSAVRGAPPAAWSREGLAALGPLPLVLPVVACASAATAGDVASLGPGDVWLPGGWALERAGEGAELLGPVVLAAPSAAIGVRARLVGGGRIVLSGDVDALLAEEGMTGSEGTNPLIDAVGEVPVVVRVEIGEATLAAREWAALGKGDVVTLGKRVGDRVVLRVGGVPVARGELVSVEGEVGVRIAEIFTEDITRA